MGSYENVFDVFRLWGSILQHPRSVPSRILRNSAHRGKLVGLMIAADIRLIKSAPPRLHTYLDLRCALDGLFEGA